MIRKIKPEDWREAATVQVESDAADNMQAIREIEQWAAEQGFARTSEYWLRPAITSENIPVFRGVCYRLTPDEYRAAEEINRRVEQRMAQMPVAVHSENAVP